MLVNSMYGFPNSCTNVFTEIRTPFQSFSSTLNTPLVIKVKIEHGIHIVIHLYDSMNDKPLDHGGGSLIAF